MLSQKSLTHMLKQRIKYDSLYALLIALTVTGIVFLPYLGQKLFSDVVTFQKFGDSLNLTYPAFIQAWKLPLKNGIDLHTFNGATELVLRANLPMAYPLFTLFSLVGKYTSFRAAFILFYAVHMVAFIYFGIMLGLRYFKLPRTYACAFSLSALSAVFSSAWYVSFYTATTLVFPMLYCALYALDTKQKRTLFLCSLPYVLCFCSGYITLAVFACGLVFLFAWCYAFLWKREGTIRETVFRIMFPPITAALAAGGYGLQVLEYQARIVGGSSSTLSEAITFALSPGDLDSIFSYAFLQEVVIEGNQNIYIGMAWSCLVVLIALCGKYRKCLESRRERFISLLLILYIAGIAISMGSVLPAQYWFYSAIPVLGSMHLPIRYMLIYLPIFYLAVAVAVANQEEPIKPCYFKVGAITSLIILVVLVMKPKTWGWVNENTLILEVALLLCFFLCAKNKFGDAKSVVALVLCTILMPMHNTFYLEMTLPKNAFQERSIVFSEEKAAVLDSAVAALPSRELYKFVSYEVDGSVPMYVPSNYTWYDISMYTMSHYMGYELHVGTPKEYFSHFPWFSTIDWNYVRNTRGDFAILNPEAVATDHNGVQQNIDFSYEDIYLNGDHRVYKLKKFVPTYYTNGELLEDTSDCLDNGYFYCPTMKNEQLLAFETDEATYFSAEVLAEQESVIAFCLYPNRNYHYYVDGEEVTPILSEMQAFIPVNAGEHQVEIRYVNRGNAAAQRILSVYYVAILGVAAVSMVQRKRGGKQ